MSHSNKKNANRSLYLHSPPFSIFVKDSLTSKKQKSRDPAEKTMLKNK